ncbi:MAG: S-adenosylmethionine:tRNA ribosyltransferase-isomerase [Prevotella sp.]|nr:S-adenosylmethionine:tRNA ribosyltransferase-isomerase [Prevotella sp.]
MTDAKKISISDFHYELPDERIARFPVSPRDHSRLLVCDNGTITDSHFYSLADFLEPGSLMVMNNTRVIRARLFFRKRNMADDGTWTDGALIEIFLLEPNQPADYEQSFASRGLCTWQCMVGNSKKWKEGELLLSLPDLGLTLSARRLQQPAPDGSYAVTFSWDNPQVSFADIIQASGQLPIPPYLKRETQQSDLTTYQTVYSKVKGSVAAPTAGLHFTPEVLAACDARGVERQELTLHVGAGTFKPVKSADMGGHVMHSEHVCVSRHLLERLLAHGCKATAVGTTSVRTLESLYYMGLHAIANPDCTEEQMHVSQWEPYDDCQEPRPTTEQALTALVDWLDAHDLDRMHASTQIIIEPGYEFHIVDRLITNFHQPQSTLLLLVSAFTKGQWRQIYQHALTHGYRFLSYGDSSLLKF